MLAVVWQFDVQPGRGEEFERLHGADGEWTKLSRRSRSFLGSSFLKELATPRRYLLVEYWSEMFVYEKHLADFSDEVDELKARRADMMVETMPDWHLRRARRARALRPDVVGQGREVIRDGQTSRRQDAEGVGCCFLTRLN